VSSEPVEQPTSPKKPIPLFRLSLTGVFMGLANLVPGVSGGTMVLALGLYDEFIGAVSALTRFRITMRSLLIVGMLFGISAVTIIGFSSIMQYLMEMFLPGMLGLFIGMTLGGAPLLIREIKPMPTSSYVTAVIGILIMALIAFVLKPDVRDPNFLLYFIGGVVGSAAMILPGISGSYMLLILGLYIPIIGGVSEMKDALKGGDISLFISTSLEVALPVGLGVLAGIISLSNLLKLFLDRYHRPTIGFLLGLLLGSVLGLYPFQETSLNKLPRYAMETEGGNKELLVYPVGWTKEDQSGIWKNLKALENDNMSVSVAFDQVDESTALPTLVETARANSGIIIAYDVNVPREVRRAAKDKEKGKVQLAIIPNTTFTPGKGLLIPFLILVGFFTTLSLGRLGGEDRKKTESEPDKTPTPTDENEATP
jgi:putative membrane protein